MDSSLIEYRAVIKFLVKEGSSVKEIADRLAKVYQQDAPKYSTVAKWAAEFKRGRQSLEDDPRSGRPLEATTPEFIRRVEDLVMADRRLKVKEVATEVGISEGSVFNILHDHLHLSKVSARWVPRNLQVQDRQQRMQLSSQLLELYRRDPEDFHLRLVTGDETWASNSWLTRPTVQIWPQATFTCFVP